MWEQPTPNVARNEGNIQLTFRAGRTSSSYIQNDKMLYTFNSKPTSLTSLLI